MVLMPRFLIKIAPDGASKPVLDVAGVRRSDCSEMK